MNKRKLIGSFIILATLILSGCASNAVIDADYNKSASPFKNYHDMKSTYLLLEKEIDSGRYVSRTEVELSGFSPKKIDTRIMNHRQLVIAFTYDGSHTAESYGIKPEEEILKCLRKGKICTAYYIKMSSTKREQIPDNSVDTIKEYADLEGTYETKISEYGVIFIFLGDRAVYTEFDSDYSPPPDRYKKKRSFWKKVFKSAID